GFIITGKNNNITFVNHFNLCGTHNMSGWMKRNSHTIYIYFFAITKTLDLNIRSNPVLKYGVAEVLTKVFFHSPSCMVAVAVGYYRHIRRVPGIEVKFAGHTVNCFVCTADVGSPAHPNLKLFIII